jgi:ABC-2 type transport system permease protein
VAQALPTTHVFAAARALVVGHPLPWDQVGIAAIGAVVVVVLSVWYLTRMLATFRDRGYISRHV